MKLTVVGLGCGAPDLLTREARDTLRCSDIVFVTKNYSHLASDCKNIFIMRDLDKALAEIRSALAQNLRVAVGVSGDPGIFSLLSTLKKEFSDFRVVPGVGSLNHFFARLGASWHDAEILSGHGRPLRAAQLLRAVAQSRTTVIFCDAVRNPAWVCETLETYRLNFMDEDDTPLHIAIGVDLSLPGERVLVGALPAILNDARAVGGHALVAIFHDDATPRPLSRPRDEDFIRSAAIPMTRAAVRSAILDELNIARDAVVWDIGAGTGSVAITCAALCPDGEVHAVERAPEALQLICANRKKFRAVNLHVHEGDAPEILRALPRPTHVFVGGSGGCLRNILTLVAGHGPGIRVCVSSVTVETAALAPTILADAGMFRGLAALNLAITRSRALGGSLLMAAQNPVTLWTAVTTNAQEDAS